MQWFRLARELGMSVRRAQAEIDSKEFAGWLALEKISPGGYERLDLHAALIASTIANANRDKKQRAQPFTLGEFQLEFSGAKAQGNRRKNPKELAIKLSQFFAGVKKD